MNKLKDKVAVVYGDGNTGGAIAKAFAREGARVFLAGRTDSKLQKIADEVKSSGGQIETEKLDALNEAEVKHSRCWFARGNGAAHTPTTA